LSEHARKRARAVLRGRDDGTIILLPDRSFVGWYRHVTLVMLALAYLAGICREEKAHLLGVAQPPTEPLTLLVLPLTIPEVRHLLGHLIWPTPRNMPRALAWSRWRRCHQRRASYFHTKRRLEAG
jgi:hypothetical protein